MSSHLSLIQPEVVKCYTSSSRSTVCKLFIVYNLFSLSDFPPKINSTVLHRRQMVTISSYVCADVLRTIKMSCEGMLNPCICSQLRCPLLKEGIGAEQADPPMLLGICRTSPARLWRVLGWSVYPKEGTHRISPCTENSDTKQQIKGSLA